MVRVMPPHAAHSTATMTLVPARLAHHMNSWAMGRISTSLCTADKQS
eukprot:COSAG02_NODE_58392_length_277_cov_1.134831_1_plen_46_part_10